MTRDGVVSLLVAGYVGLALFFLLRFAFHMLAAAADRKDKSIAGTVNPFTRYRPSNYSSQGWQHLVRSRRNAICFALMIGVPLLLKGIVSLLNSQGR